MNVPGNHLYFAYAINDWGQIVGSAADGGPYIWYNGSIQLLGALGMAEAYGINDFGQVVGTNGLHAVLYEKGKLYDLDTFSSDDSYATAINNLGQVAGTVYRGGFHAFLYTNRAMHDLGTLPGGTESRASALNQLGQIVGIATTGALDPYGYPLYHAFLYNGRALKDLNTLIRPDSGWELLNASGINTRGQIVGGGTINGNYHVYLLTPR